jgi:hypothetical protein
MGQLRGNAVVTQPLARGHKVVRSVPAAARP